MNEQRGRGLLVPAPVDECACGSEVFTLLSAHCFLLSEMMTRDGRRQRGASAVWRCDHCLEPVLVRATAEASTQIWAEEHPALLQEKP